MAMLAKAKVQRTTCMMLYLLVLIMVLLSIPSHSENPIATSPDIVSHQPQAFGVPPGLMADKARFGRICLCDRLFRCYEGVSRKSFCLLSLRFRGGSADGDPFPGIVEWVPPCRCFIGTFLMRILFSSRGHTCACMRSRCDWTCVHPCSVSSVDSNDFPDEGEQEGMRVQRREGDDDEMSQEGPYDSKEELNEEVR